MNSNADSTPQPPRQPPLYLLYLLGLPQSCTREELSAEWDSQVVPLLNIGPQFLWDRSVRELMAAGAPATKVERIFKQTRRGAKLFDSIDREAKARARLAGIQKPPFLEKPAIRSTPKK